MSADREGAATSHTAEEIASQPGCWRLAAELAETVAEVLPRRGERVVAIGCGTGYHVARAYAALREGAGHGETDAFPASELPCRRYDRVVAVSRTGQTSEVLRALAALPAPVPVVAVTSDGSSPLAAVAGEVVELAFARERSIVETRFATSALVLLRGHLGEDVATLPAAAARALAMALPEGSLEARQLALLGRSWTAALAKEAALKLREMARASVEAHNAMEYRHGPISLAEPGVLVWCLGAAPAGLAGEVASTGARFVATPAGLDPLAELVRAQRLALELALRRRLDPDHPRHLSRAVVLEDT